MVSHLQQKEAYKPLLFPIMMYITDSWTPQSGMRFHGAQKYKRNIDAFEM